MSPHGNNLPPGRRLRRRWRDRRRHVRDEYCAFLEESGGECPTVKEMCLATGFPKTTVHRICVALGFRFREARPRKPPPD